MPDFRKSIQQERERRALTISDLAALAGVHRVALSKYLSASKDMTGSSIEAVMRALDMRVTGPMPEAAKPAPAWKPPPLPPRRGT